MKEEWRAIKSYEGMYEVSTYGRVRTLDRVVRRCTCGRAISSYRGRILKGAIHQQGYPVVALSKKNKATQVFVHRLVLEAFIGKCPAGMEACHKNGKRDDPRLENLRWDTRKGNHADKWLHGTMLIGEKTNSAKLTVNEVREIKASESPTSVLAHAYRVGRNTIDRIRNGQTWKHV